MKSIFAAFDWFIKEYQNSINNDQIEIILEYLISHIKIEEFELSKIEELGESWYSWGNKSSLVARFIVRGDLKVGTKVSLENNEIMKLKLNIESSSKFVNKNANRAHINISAIVNFIVYYFFKSISKFRFEGTLK